MPCDQTERAIINALQGGFPITERPFRDAARALGLEEEELIDRVKRLVDSGTLSRFGPLWNAERLGGDVCLCAMAVPAERIDEVAGLVNAHIEVAHNYERTHRLNMWFVISSEKTGRIEEVASTIEEETGLAVHRMPKLREFHIGFRVDI